jgi:hypothetical protein
MQPTLDCILPRSKQMRRRADKRWVVRTFKSFRCRACWTSDAQAADRCCPRALAHRDPLAGGAKLSNPPVHPAAPSPPQPVGFPKPEGR